MIEIRNEVILGSTDVRGFIDMLQLEVLLEFMYILLHIY